MSTVEKVLRAGLYVRVSQDRSQERRSVTQQEDEARALCARQGWDVAGLYADNDIGASRYSKKTRDDYDRLCEDIATSALDVVVVWESSRLTRSLGMFVQLRDLCAEHDVLWSVDGRQYDLNDPDDRERAGMNAVRDEHESERTRKRIMRALNANAAAGRPHGRLLYGYKREYEVVRGETKFVAQVPDPLVAPLIVEAAQRVASGETPYKIALDFTRREIPRPHAKTDFEWNLSQIRRMVLNPGYIGKRVQRGKIVGEACWPGIIDEETYYACVRRFSDPTRRTNRETAVRHLLSGILTCGECGSKTIVLKQRGGYNAYMCKASFCAARKQSFVDSFIEDLTIYRLSRPDAVSLFVDPQRDEATQRASGELASTRARLSELSDLAVSGEISPGSFARMERQLIPEIEALEKRSRAVSLGPVLGDVVGPKAGEVWEQLDIMRRREIIRALFSSITLLRTPERRRGKNGFDPRSVDYSWREF